MDIGKSSITTGTLCHRVAGTWLSFCDIYFGMARKIVQWERSPTASRDPKHCTNWTISHSTDMARVFKIIIASYVCFGGRIWNGGRTNFRNYMPGLCDTYMCRVWTLWDVIFPRNSYLSTWRKSLFFCRTPVVGNLHRFTNANLILWARKASVRYTCLPACCI